MHYGDERIVKFEDVDFSPGNSSGGRQKLYFFKNT